MDKSNLELFKQALNEAVSNKFDKMADECTEEIVYSEKHKLAMRTIVYGKTDNKRVWTPKMRRIIAILIAVSLLLTSCGIIFRNEIREIFEEFFVKLTYDGDEESQQTIKEIYSLSYVPEGYGLEKESITSVRVKYNFKNKSGETLCFEQRAITLTDFVIDSESGYSEFYTVNDLNIYYRFTNKMHCYIWSDDNYTLYLKSSKAISKEEIVLIIVKMSTKQAKNKKS